MRFGNPTDIDRAGDAEVMRWLIDAIAEEVWALCGSDGTLDWQGVERYLSFVASRAHHEARQTKHARAPLPAIRRPRAGRISGVGNARPRGESWGTELRVCHASRVGRVRNHARLR
jgi:hypothetical protein